MGESEIIGLLMEVALVNDYQFAHNAILLASKLYWGQRSKPKYHCFRSEIWPIANWPLSNLICSNAVVIWCLSENELIWVSWGHIGLKEPRNYKLKLGWAQAKSTQSHLDRSIDFCGSRNFLTQTYSESSQNSHLIDVLHYPIVSI